jgi:universal stress protein A
VSTYKNVLVVVDLSESSARIAEQAKQIACDTALTLLHVVEYVPLEPVGETLLPTIQIEDELVQRAKMKLAALVQQLGLGSCAQLVETGSIKGEIVRVAQERKADLIVVGSRERHGLAILVNFTEDTVLHAAPCDVLAVRLK